MWALLAGLLHGMDVERVLNVPKRIHPFVELLRIMLDLWRGPLLVSLFCWFLHNSPYPTFAMACKAAWFGRSRRLGENARNMILDRSLAE